MNLKRLKTTGLTTCTLKFYKENIIKNYNILYVIYILKCFVLLFFGRRLFYIILLLFYKCFAIHKNVLDRCTNRNSDPRFHVPFLPLSEDVLRILMVGLVHSP